MVLHLCHNLKFILQCICRDFSLINSNLLLNNCCISISMPHVCLVFKMCFMRRSVFFCCLLSLCCGFSVYLSLNYHCHYGFCCWCFRKTRRLFLICFIHCQSCFLSVYQHTKLFNYDSTKWRKIINNNNNNNNNVVIVLCVLDFIRF